MSIDNGSLILFGNYYFLIQLDITIKKDCLW